MMGVISNIELKKMKCSNYYFGKQDLFCPDCGQEVALHGTKKKNKKIYDDSQYEQEMRDVFKREGAYYPIITDPVSVNVNGKQNLLNVERKRSKLPLLAIFWLIGAIIFIPFMFGLPKDLIVLDGLWVLLSYPFLVLTFYLFIYLPIIQQIQWKF